MTTKFAVFESIDGRVHWVDRFTTQFLTAKVNGRISGYHFYFRLVRPVIDGMNASPSKAETAIFLSMIKKLEEKLEMKPDAKPYVNGYAATFTLRRRHTQREIHEWVRREIILEKLAY